MAEILVAEDDASVRLILRHILRKAGHEVTVSEDGSAALELLDRRRFDILIADIGMPEIDGLTLAVRLRESSSNPETPVVILTSNVLDDTLQRAERLGVSAYLTKPVSSSLLLRTVAELVQQ